MEIIEKIGDYEVIKQSELILHGDECVSIKISDNGEPMILKFVICNQKETSKSSINQSLDNNCMTFEFVNCEPNRSWMGIFEPLEIATSNKGEIIYLQCAIFTINVYDKNRIFKYSLLKKTKSHETEI